jgi:hypothetical protein
MTITDPTTAPTSSDPQMPAWQPPAQPGFDGTQQYGQQVGFGQRQVSALLAVALIAGGAYWYTHRHHTTTVSGQGTTQGQHGRHGSTQGQQGSTQGQQGSTQGQQGSTQGGGSPTSWPASLADFAALIGTGPGTMDGWNGAPCTPEQSSGNVVLMISCVEPDSAQVQLVEFASSSSVDQLVQQAVASGAESQTWSHNNGPSVGDVITATSGNPEILTTFTNYPTVVVDLAGASLSALQSDWSAAPLP